MPLIQNPGPARKLMRGLRLTHLPDAVLAPEMVGVVIVDDYSESLDELARNSAGSHNQPAVAGQQSNVYILAEVQGQYFILDRIIVRASAATDISIIAPNVILTPLSTAKGQFRDLALPGRPAADMGRFSGAAPAGIRVHQLHFSVDAIVLDVSYTLRLRPGEAQAPICVSTASVNVALDVSFDWREFSLPLI